MIFVVGCAPPSTRRAVRSVSSSFITASRRSSSGAAVGVAHVSCLAEQAKILWDETEENIRDQKERYEKWARWHTCSLCEQRYHGVVARALGWACWKTYVGRPEADQVRLTALTQLAVAEHHEDALSMQKENLSMLIGGVGGELGTASERVLEQIMIVQSHLATTYSSLGRLEDALRTARDVYSGHLKLHGEEHPKTLLAANNYAGSLSRLQRFEEAKSLLQKTVPVARRDLGESDQYTLTMITNYAIALSRDPAATLDDLRESVTMLEEAERTGRRVLGNAHPMVLGIQKDLRESRKALADARASSEQLALAGLAFVAALAFLAGRRYLRR